MRVCMSMQFGVLGPVCPLVGVFGEMGGWGAFSLNIYQLVGGLGVSVSGGMHTGIDVSIL